MSRRTRNNVAATMSRLTRTFHGVVNSHSRTASPAIREVLSSQLRKVVAPPRKLVVPENNADKVVVASGRIESMAPLKGRDYSDSRFYAKRMHPNPRRRRSHDSNKKGRPHQTISVCKDQRFAEE